MTPPGTMPAPLSDRVHTWRVFCPRCAFRARIQARPDQIADHIALACPSCRQLGLDAIEQSRLERRKHAMGLE